MQQDVTPPPVGSLTRLMRLMIQSIQVGDVLTMVGPDGQHSDRFTLADVPRLCADTIWLYRANDVPIVVDRSYGLDSTFTLHSRVVETRDERRARP